MSLFHELAFQEVIALIIWLVEGIMLVTFLCVACYIDIKRRIVPNWLVLVLGSFGIFVAVFDLLGVGFPAQGITLFDRFLGALIAFIPLALVSFCTHELGFGDVKLACVLGFILGIKGAVIALCVASFAGALLALAQLIGKSFSLSKQGTIAYAPAICIGSLAAALLI